LPVVVIHDLVLELHHPVIAHLLRHGLAVPTVVMIAATGVVMIVEAMETGAVMIVEVTVEMIAVEIMVVVAVPMDAVLIASLLLMLIRSVKSVRSMVTLPMRAGGATRMTRKTGMMVTREQTLPPMVLIQIGILIQGPLTTSPVN
jgi:hypothetical protein